jgi:hypothetical protein
MNRNGKTNKGTGKLRHIVGIGGINCYCCTLGPLSVTKHLWNKIERKILKREAEAEILAEIGEMSL